MKGSYKYKGVNLEDAEFQLVSHSIGGKPKTIQFIVSVTAVEGFPPIDFLTLDSPYGGEEVNSLFDERVTDYLKSETLPS